MSLFYPHQFETTVQEYDVGSNRYVYKVLMIPQALAKDLPLDTYPRLRIAGEIDGFPFEGALTPAKGEWYLLLSNAKLKAMGRDVGDRVTVHFEIGDQDLVDIPQELAEALDEAPPIRALWEEKTPGFRRGLAYRVASAKRPATKLKRIDEVFEILLGRRDVRGKTLQ
ncbi:MAG: YdeI/OmpD-associated family protein [Acidobacteriota bacterium]